MKTDDKFDPEGTTLSNGGISNTNVLRNLLTILERSPEMEYVSTRLQTFFKLKEEALRPRGIFQNYYLVLLRKFGSKCFALCRKFLFFETVSKNGKLFFEKNILFFLTRRSDLDTYFLDFSPTIDDFPGTYGLRSDLVTHRRRHTAQPARLSADLNLTCLRNTTNPLKVGFATNAHFGISLIKFSCTFKTDRPFRM